MKAERTRRAVVTEAQGRREAAITTAEGAKAAVAINKELQALIAQAGRDKDADGVTTTCRDRLTGKDVTIRSKYLVGADGGNSNYQDDIAVSTGDIGFDTTELLTAKGYDPMLGARPLRRAIQRYIEDPLADFVLRAELTPGATIMVEKAPEEDDREVSLTVVEPKKVPASVGGGAAAAPAQAPAMPGTPNHSTLRQSTWRLRA